MENISALFGDIIEIFESNSFENKLNIIDKIAFCSLFNDNFVNLMDKYGLNYNYYDTPYDSEGLKYNYINSRTDMCTIFMTFSSVDSESLLITFELGHGKFSLFMPRYHDFGYRYFVYDINISKENFIEHVENALTSIK